MYLQITLRIEYVLPNTPPEIVTRMLQYRVPERVLAIDDSRLVSASASKEEKNFMGTPIKDNGRDDQESHAMPMTEITLVQWYPSMAIVVILLGTLSLFVVLVLYQSFRRHRRRQHKASLEDGGGGGGYAASRKQQTTERIQQWFASAARHGVFNA